MADARVVAARLWHFAAHHAASRGYVFGDGVEQMLPMQAKQMARLVLDRAQAERVPEEGMIRLAEGNLATFIDAMIEAAHQERGYLESRGPVIGEVTWGAAISRLCPLFPIC
ncbi:hypothetical protein [Elioraea rosea]|uniref:hypothetical protein n=1 Tax=Elioraea rosea TaxID=2492390 RepID=UPI0011827E82|nr:hypothetical protein [Elioraea rosea]